MKNKISKIIFISTICIVGCNVPSLIQVQNNQGIPDSFNSSSDSNNVAATNFKTFFSDPYLINLIDTALINNYELLSTLQDIEIAKNSIRIKHADLLPKVDGAVGLGLEKTARYTAQGAGNASTEITSGKEVPEPIGDIFLGFRASWEIDVWGKLKDSKKSAALRYLKTIEGKNFLITNIIGEIANNYYTLLALDNQLDIIHQAIDLQEKELEVLKSQKESAKATELAVKQFEALVYNSQGQEFDIQQQIVEVENKINFILGRFPQRIVRDKNNFNSALKNISMGIPAQLLQNRPDVKQAEIELEAAKLDVKIARKEFLPSVGITGLWGLQGFKPKYIIPRSLESLAFNFIGDLASPLINRNALFAEFGNATAIQQTALYEYQKRIVNGYIEVYNQMNNINNLKRFYDIKTKEAVTLMNSISIASDLFQNARANYLEVLVVQRDALSAKLELIEAKKDQLISTTNMYKALGGGWR